MIYTIHDIRRFNLPDDQDDYREFIAFTRSRYVDLSVEKIKLKREIKINPFAEIDKISDRLDQVINDLETLENFFTLSPDEFKNLLS